MFYLFVFFFFFLFLFIFFFFFFFSSRRRHTRLVSDWSSDVCSSDLTSPALRSRRWRRCSAERSRCTPTATTRRWLFPPRTRPELRSAPSRSLPLSRGWHRQSILSGAHI